MQTYYELLKVEKTANASEIEIKLDDQYTKWRGLVTHHDPQVVDQAQQALAMLEEMRTILLNPDKRSTYDTAIASQGEGMAGLADPDMILAANPMQGGGMAPPRPRQTMTDDKPKPELDRTDAWICTDPKCKKANQIGTQFCANCGKRIGCECPKCGKLVEISNKFCSYCGVNKAEHFSKSQTASIRELETEIGVKTEMLSLAETNPGQFAIRYHVGNKNSNGCLLSFVVILIMSVGIGIGAAAESAFLGIVLGIVAPVVIAVMMSNASKNKSVREYVENVLKPQIKTLRQQIKEIQKAKYGDNI